MTRQRANDSENDTRKRARRGKSFFHFYGDIPCPPEQMTKKHHPNFACLTATENDIEDLITQNVKRKTLTLIRCPLLAAGRINLGSKPPNPPNYYIK